MQKYKAVIVGLGNIAWKYNTSVDTREPLTHAQAYCNNPKVVLAGGFSPDPDERSAFNKYYKVPVFSSIEELLKTVKPEIVSICSPSQYHFKQAQYCIDAGIPMIWLEKPPAMNLKELDLLIKKSKSGSSRILVNYQRRYSSCYNRLKELVKKNALGKIVYVNLAYSKGLLVNGSHIIDILFYILGDNRRASLEFVAQSTDTDNPSFMIKFSEGLVCSVSGLSAPYHCRDIVITGEKARASIVQEGMKVLWEVKSGQKLFPGYYRLQDSDKNQIGHAGLEGSMPAALDNLISSYEKQKDTASSLYTSRNAQSIIEQVLRQVKHS